MLTLLQYKNIGEIITLYMVSAVVGLIFIRTLASNLILEDAFWYIFFKIGSTDLGFRFSLLSGSMVVLNQGSLTIHMPTD